MDHFHSQSELICKGHFVPQPPLLKGL